MAIPKRVVGLSPPPSNGSPFQDRDPFKRILNRMKEVKKNRLHVFFIAPSSPPYYMAWLSRKSIPTLDDTCMYMYY